MTNSFFVTPTVDSTERRVLHRKPACR